jgi:hypothetical protein
MSVGQKPVLQGVELWYEAIQSSYFTMLASFTTCCGPVMTDQFAPPAKQHKVKQV